MTILTRLKCPYRTVRAFDRLYGQDRGREREVHQQRQKVNDGGDDRGGHDRRVKAELLGKQRKRRADHFCKADCHGHRDADHKGDHVGDALALEQEHVHKDDLCKARHRQTDAAEDGDTDLLPDDAADVAELDLVQADTADDRDARLRAGVAACIHQHRDERRQARQVRERVFKARDDKAGQRRGHHEQQQPRDAVFPDLDRRGAHVRVLGREHSRHLFHVLGRLVLHDVHRVVEGDDADQPVLGVHDRQGKEVVFGEHLRDLLLIVERVDRNDMLKHDRFDRGRVILAQKQILDRDKADQLASAGDIAGVDGLFVDAGTADAEDGFLHRHIRPQGHIFRRHDGAGGVFGVAQDLIDLLAHVRLGLG